MDSPSPQSTDLVGVEKAEDSLQESTEETPR